MLRDLFDRASAFCTGFVSLAVDKQLLREVTRNVHSGNNFSVIYLKEQESLKLAYKKAQLKKVTIHNTEGKALYQQDLNDKNKTLFEMDLAKLSGKEFMLTLYTDMKKMYKFVIIE